jgi:hypothetical protein
MNAHSTMEAAMPPSGMEPAPGAGAPPASEPKRAGRRARPGAAGAVAAVVVVVALIVVVLHRPGGSPLRVSPAAPGADWQTYHDPLGLFSARIPANWTVRATTGTQSYGDRTGSATETAEIIQFNDPALGAVLASFEVSAEPIRNDFERHWYCQGFSRKNGTFHGIPVEQEFDALWLFETANAHFQLNVNIPGVLGAPHSETLHPATDPTPTPLPAALVASERATLATILDAFQPTNGRALSSP